MKLIDDEVNGMNRIPRSLVHFVLGVVACVLAVSFSTTPSFSTPTALMQNSVQSGDRSQVDLSLIAQGMGSSMKRYSATLTSSNVVPNAPMSSAMGMAEASLKGDRLMVRGRFSGLSSALRDYATDPVNPPNPKITSAVHIHRGATSENGPFQFALTVKMNNSSMGNSMSMGSGMGMGGTFSGEYTLTPEQLQALADGKLYLDLHTKQNRAGELRGILQPA